MSENSKTYYAVPEAQEGYILSYPFFLVMAAQATADSPEAMCAELDARKVDRAGVRILVRERRGRDSWLRRATEAECGLMY